MISVLIVEDSVTQREILCRIVRNDDGMTVIGEARNGIEAVKKVRELSPDVVLMDIHMDQMNGIEATKIIMRDHPAPVVIMSSTLEERDVDHAVDAMQAGALMAIEKPQGAALLHLSKMAPHLLQVLREAAATKVRGPSVQPSVRSVIHPEKYQSPAHPIKVIGVASSAGGPSVLVQIFAALPHDFPIPILLVQHISAGFEEGFAHWLSTQTRLPTRIISADQKATQKLTPGIWMGPSSGHIVLTSRHQIGLVPRQPSDIHCPSGNPMLASIAQQYGKSAVGIVLTGMGDDGAAGLLTMKQAGGQTIIQDEATAMVWGMPKAAKILGAHDYELNPAEIANALCLVAKR